MANICDTVVQFMGDENMLNDLFSKLSDKSLYELASDFGLSKEYISSITSDYSPFRGDVIDIDAKSYRIYQNDAWVPHVAVWRAICKKAYNNDISFVYKAEEFGCDVFVNTDETGLFFPETIVCDYDTGCCNDVVYFTTETDFIKWFNETFDCNVRTIDAAKIVSAEKYEDGYITIGVFSRTL